MMPKSKVCLFLSAGRIVRVQNIDGWACARFIDYVIRFASKAALEEDGGEEDESSDEEVILICFTGVFKSLD